MISTSILSIILSLVISFQVSVSDKVYAFQRYEGKNCMGTGNPRDILRDFPGNAQECMAKCSELDCDGFIRVNNGSEFGYNQQCYFRNGLGQPYQYNVDDRNCYKPIGIGLRYIYLSRIS